MKKSKKQKKTIPEVHILGDLQDIKTLVAGVNKKKTLVIFQDREEGSYYLEVDGEIQMILKEDIKELEKEYKLIFFSFFPSQKISEPVVEVPASNMEMVKDKKRSIGEKKTTKKKSHKAKKK
jgi:hypothetical protein